MTNELAFYNNITNQLKYLDSETEKLITATPLNKDRVQQCLSKFDELISLLQHEEKMLTKKGTEFRSSYKEFVVIYRRLKRKFSEVLRYAKNANKSDKDENVVSLKKAKDMMIGSEETANDILTNLKKQEESIFRSRGKARSLLDILKRSDKTAEVILTRMLENRIIRLCASGSVLLSAVIVLIYSKSK